MGILPVLASVHDAARYPRCLSGEYDAQSAKLSVCRPFRAPRARIQETGGTRADQCDDIVFEWQSPHERTRTESSRPDAATGR